MRIISIPTALDQLRFAVKNPATLERDTRAIASKDCKLLTVARKVEAIQDVEKEAKIAKEVPKRMRFPLQLLDNQVSSTNFWLLRSVTSHFQALYG